MYMIDASCIVKRMLPPTPKRNEKSSSIFFTGEAFFEVEEVPEEGFCTGDPLLFWNSVSYTES